MRAYLALLGKPSVLRVMASQLVARLPLGFLVLSVLIYVQSETNKFALAGLVVGAMSIGEAIAIPVTARLTIFFGIRPFLWSISSLNALAIFLFLFVGKQEITLIALGFIAGISTPPLAAVVRALFPLLVGEDETRTLFALDTSAQELIWIIGPVLAAGTAALMGTSAPLVVCALVAIGGATWFLTSPVLKKVVIPKSQSRFGVVLKNRSLLIGIAAIFPMVTSFTAFEVGLLGFFNANVFLVGCAIACEAVGSLVGGLILGPRKLGLSGTLWLMAFIIFCAAAVLFFRDMPVLFFVSMFFSGVGFAPVLSALLLMISHSSAEADAPESFGWLNTAGIIGGAFGTAIAGVIADSFGVLVSLIVAGAFTVVPLLVLLIARAFAPIPGLSKSDYEPGKPSNA